MQISNKGVSTSNWYWLVPAAASAGVTFLTLFVLPPDRTLTNLLDFLFRVLPLVCAVLAIAWFPQQRTRGSWLLLLGYIFYMGYIDSAFVIEIDALNQAAVAGQVATQFSSFYIFNIFVNAFTVLLALFAYRLGGGRTTAVIKLGFAAILVMISGLNDLTMWLMYPWPGQRPVVFDWASHVAIFIGRDPNLFQMLVFLGIHLGLAIIIMRLPLERWLRDS